MATIKTLSEQVLRLLKTGDREAGSNVHPKEVEVAIKQTLNALLKAEYYSQVLPTGETIPEGCLLATYDSVPVVQYKGVSKAVLPAIPVRLPRNMGVFHVSKTDCVFDPFIPMRMGVYTMLRQQPLISDVLGQVAYELVGKEVVFNKDLTVENPPVTEVMMRLVVSDFNNFSDYELLPVDADMEMTVVQEVYKLFSTEQPKVEVATSVAENPKQ